MLSRRQKNSGSIDVWPGFVDALSTVVLVFIFVLIGIISSQIYLSEKIMNNESSLNDMKHQISDLCFLLYSEKCKNGELSKINFDLLTKIETLQKTVNFLKESFSENRENLEYVTKEKETLEEKVNDLNHKIQSLMESITTERKLLKESNNVIKKLKSENEKLEESSKFRAYRSEFFDKLHSVIGDIEGIKIVGDRFIFQSELFFDTASADLSDEGKAKLDDLASVVLDLSSKIPEDMQWILRVDGHTNKRPISGKLLEKFASNWELSTARSISVVKYLISKKIPAFRLVAAGFGENQPISSGRTENDLSKNRRIEFKLDAR